MRLKRFIALLLTAVYLFAVGGPSFATLSCRCFASLHTAQHVCCQHCGHQTAVAKVVMYEPCCSDRHSTEILLYTGSSPDSQKFAKRIAAPDLPDALSAEFAVCTDVPKLVGCDRGVLRGVGTFPIAHISACGLRAPPVLV